MRTPNILLDTEKVQVFKQSVLVTIQSVWRLLIAKSRFLKSDNFALSIVKNLHLTQDPEFVRSGGLIDTAINLVLYSIKLPVALLCVKQTEIGI